MSKTTYLNVSIKETDEGQDEPRSFMSIASDKSSTPQEISEVVKHCYDVAVLMLCAMNLSSNAKILWDIFNKTQDHKVLSCIADRTKASVSLLKELMHKKYPSHIRNKARNTLRLRARMGKSRELRPRARRRSRGSKS